MSAAPRLLHDDTPATDPFALLLAQFRAGVRAELRAELRAALADLGAYLEMEREQALRRLAGQYFPDAAYQDDAALRQFARAVWARGFRAGHAAGRDEVR